MSQVTQNERLTAARSLAGTALAQTLHQRLDDAAIPALIFKGPVTDAWLFTDDEARGFGDIDVIVAPDAYGRAERVLSTAGFVSRWDGPSPEWAPEHAETWASPDWPLPVDLHRRLWGFGASPEVVWDALWSDREPFGAVSSRAAGQGFSFTVPGPAARTLLVALHAAHHPGEARPEDDLRRALKQLPDAHWRAAADLAERLDAPPALVAGLVLLPEGEGLRTRLGLDGVAPNMPRVESPLWDAPRGSEGFVHLGETRGVAAKARLMGRELVPSADFMRERSRFRDLARRGPLGLTLARALRIMDLARNARSSYQAARRRGR